MNIKQLITKNQKRWDNMHLNASRIPTFDYIAKRLVAKKDIYQKIEAATKVPWFVIAVIHERESGQDFTKQLSQGDSLNQVSRHDPKGRGPFYGDDAFYRAALDALIDCPPHASKWTDWTAGGAMTLLEEYNGLGYAAMGVPSAYVWSGSDQYKSGKYVADHVYRAGVVDVQEGCAPLIARMMALDPSIQFTKEAA